MSQSGIYSTTGGSTTGAVLTVTGNLGGAVSPDVGGNLTVSGLNGFVTTGTPGSNLLSLSNYRNVSNYVVSNDGLSEYSTIQSAIDQAVTDGADANNPALVWIYPGSYAESVAFADYVFVAAALDEVYIFGNCSYFCAGLLSISNINFLSSNASPALDVSGSGVLNIDSGQITANTGIGLSITGSVNTTLVNTTLVAPNPGSYYLSMDGGLLTSFGGYYINNDTQNDIVNFSIISLISTSCLNAGFFLQSGSSLSALSCYFVDSQTILPNLTLDNDASANVYSCVFSSANNTGYFVQGGGSFTYDNITPTATATELDPSLTLNGGTEITARQNASTTIAQGVTYIVDAAGPIVFTLPGIAQVGSFFKIIGYNGTYSIAQQAGQTIHQGASSSTTGVGGSLNATQQYTCVYLICTESPTDWVVVESSGTFILV
tara:strand:- start:709 stop:2004 length:1296 start_codon:yes stop_codon:yes gene_type:complete